ncbi:MAG: heme-binding protein [Deltaproteobacteria bacterium]|nr:heme-binding protein [Deltaproteobacteria bacterium]
MPRVAEPRFEITDRDGAFEVRRYPGRVIAETRVHGAWSAAGNEGFRRLAGYIFGKNRGRAKVAMTAPVGQRPATIAMTAPVGQRRDADDWLVTFTMPAGETLATLPVPDDARVTLREVPPSEVAVAIFSGRWTAANLARHEAALRAWATARGLALLGEPEVNRYDPPFTLWFRRRNEIWFALATADAATA